MLFCANINDLLDRVEDPERRIKQIIREMEVNISHAREALSRKQEHVRIAETMDKSLGSAKYTTTRLKDQLRALEMKLDEAKRKKVV